MPQQAARYEADAWEENIADYLETKTKVTDRPSGARWLSASRRRASAPPSSAASPPCSSSLAGSGEAEGLARQAMVDEEMNLGSNLEECAYVIRPHNSQKLIGEADHVNDFAWVVELDLVMA